MNVVFHIDEEKRWPLVQGNVTHMLAFANSCSRISISKSSLMEELSGS